MRREAKSLMPRLERPRLQAARWIWTAMVLTIANAVGAPENPSRIEELQFHSEVLGREMPFTIVRPADEAGARGAVLFVLHGRGRDHRSLINSEPARAALLAAPFHVVLPKGEDGWYANLPGQPGARYEDYLLEVMRAAEQRLPISRDPRWRAIAGWSMGGFGAVRFAERHPEEIGTVASIIGLLDFPREPISKADGYKVPVARFGTDAAIWDQFNPLQDVTSLQARRVLVVLATESWDRGMNERFIAALQARDIQHEALRLPGGHDFSVVEAALPGVIDFCSRSFAFETARHGARQRQRRLIFNDDTATARASQVPLATPEEYLAVQIAPLAGTLVDTLAIDTTAGTFGRFGHRSEVAEMFLTREGRYRYNVLPDFVKLGTDPLQLGVEQGRRQGDEVFWSVRMNDTHDASNPLLTPEFKRAHPEWLMGTKETPPAYGQWSAVDYGRPEVREHILKCITDVVTRYDIDGVELDFWRHPVYFRSTAEGMPAHPDEVAAMTGLLRRIRASLDREALKRGRPLVLAIKSPDSIEYCLALGLDLEGWMREQLVDLWEPGGYFRTEPWTTGVALARRHGVSFYACLPENRMRDPEAKQERDSLPTVRARAMAAWAAGVDGIAMFNFNVPVTDPQLWHELGDPTVLRTKPKKYFASYQGVSNSRGYFPAGPYVQLPTLTPNSPQELMPGVSRDFAMHVGDDLSGPTKLQARLHVRAESTAGIEPMVQWAGTDLQLSRLNEHAWIAAVPGALVTPGEHPITVLAHDAVKLTDLMLHIE